MLIRNLKGRSERKLRIQGESALVGCEGGTEEEVGPRWRVIDPGGEFSLYTSGGKGGLYKGEKNPKEEKNTLL